MKKILLCILVFINSLFAFGITGKVVKVSDGDSFFLRAGKKTYRVRMFGIDAPELHQDHGDICKKYLEDMILKKKVNIKVITEDKYGRKIGKVFYKNKDINLEMLKSGHAWFYEFYAKKNKKYAKSYKYAKENKLGIWKYENLENPRDYRLKNKRKD